MHISWDDALAPMTYRLTADKCHWEHVLSRSFDHTNLTKSSGCLGFGSAPWMGSLADLPRGYALLRRRLRVDIDHDHRDAWPSSLISLVLGLVRSKEADEDGTGGKLKTIRLGIRSEPSQAAGKPRMTFQPTRRAGNSCLDWDCRTNVLACCAVLR